MSQHSRFHLRSTGRLLAAVGLLLILAACGGGGGPPAPDVTSTTPSDGATNVGVDSDIVVSFSTTMEPTSVEGAFDANPSVTCNFSWNGANDEVTCSPQADLNAGATYTVTIGSSATSADGESLPGDHSFSFTTGSGATPTVTSTTPTDGATGVSLNSNIKVEFSEAMNRSATQAAFSTSPSVSCTFFWNAAGDALTCMPDSNFSSNTSYNVTVGTGAESAAGSSLASEEQFSFDTGTTTLDDCELGASQLGNCLLD